MFRLTTPKGFILVLVYVDDLLVAAHNEQEGADFLQKLTGIWKIKLTGKIPALRSVKTQEAAQRFFFTARTCAKPHRFDSSVTLLLRRVVQSKTQ